MTNWSELRARAASDVGAPPTAHRRGDSPGFVALLPQLLLYKWITGSWIVSSYSTRRVRLQLRIAARVERALQHPERTVLLVAGAAARRGRDVRRRWDGRGKLLSSVAIVFADPHLPGRQLVRLAVRRQLWPSRVRRRVRPRRAVSRRLFCVGGRTPPRWLGGSSLFAVASVCLSIAQMIQYWMHIIPFSNTTWAQYRALFLRFR